MTTLNAHADIASDARGLNFDQVFIYTYTECMGAANVQASLSLHCLKLQ